MDCIFVKQLAMTTTIGVYDWEKEIKQSLFLDIEMFGDFSQAGASDMLDDTIDYAAVSSRITSFVEQNSFELIEKVAEAVAELILTEFKPAKVHLTLQKPGAVANAQSVGVAITRHRNS